MATLALRVAFGQHGKLQDRPGALQEIAATSLGRLLRGALAVGLGGYALWRFAEATLGRTLEAGEDQGFLKRVGQVARGLLLACTAAGLMAYGLFCLVQARYSEV